MNESYENIIKNKKVEPLTNTSRRRLNGWGATMVMDLKDEYQF